MKRITAIVFSVLAILTTASGAMAQGTVVRATIPFPFTVETRSLPAGTYEVVASLGTVIRIQNSLDPHITAYVATLPDSTEAHDNRNVMVFKKYGNQYFLHDIFCPAVMNVSLFRSREERQVRQQSAMLNDASTILIAAK
jgi:hypothetical protein